MCAFCQPFSSCICEFDYVKRWRCPFTACYRDFIIGFEQISQVALRDTVEWIDDLQCVAELVTRAL